MKSILRCRVRNNFRNSSLLKTESRFFFGRERLVSRLSGIIQNRTSSTVLIGGARGTGKTSFVKEALAKSKSAELGIVVQISMAETETKDLRKTILSALIRGLYFELKNIDRTGGINKEILELVEDLYEKTYYSEFERRDFAELFAGVKQNQEVTNSNENKTHLEIGSALKTVLKAAIGAITLAPFLNTIIGLNIPFWGSVALFFVGLAFLFLVLSVDITIIHSTTKVEKDEKKIDIKSQRTGIAKLDISPNTLEIGLKHALLKLSKSGKKIVFVIDELDKLDEEDSGEIDIHEHQIYQVIKPLKNLFTLSDAIYIFIASSNFYHAITKKKRSNPYSAFHTMFTDRIFLDPLYYKDIESILDSYLEEKAVDEITYKKFRYYVCWLAKNHIFDIHNLIEDYIDYEDQSEEINLKIDTGDGRGNLPQNWEVAATLQVFLSATLDEKSYPTDAEMNELLYLTLHRVTEKIYQEEYLEVRDGKFLDILDENDQKNLRLDSLDNDKRVDVSGSIEDMLLRMERSEQFSVLVSGEEEEERDDVDSEIDPKTQKEKVYYCTFFALKEDLVFPDLEIIKKKNIVTEYEQIFVKQFDLLKSARLNIILSGLKSFAQYEAEYRKFKLLADKISSEKARFERKSLVLELTERVEKILISLNKTTRDDLVALYMKNDPNITKWDIGSGKTNTSMWDADPTLSKFYQELHSREDLIFDSNYLIMHDAKNNSYTILGFNLDVKIQEIYERIGRFYRVNRTKTRIINLTSEGNNKKKIWKVVTVKDDLSHLREYDRILRERFGI